MKLRITKPVIIRGFQDTKVGDEIEVQPDQAGELLGMGICETIQTREPVIENRDPETQPVQSSRQRRAK